MAAESEKPPAAETHESAGGLIGKDFANGNAAHNGHGQKLVDGPIGAGNEKTGVENANADGKRELLEEDCENELAFAFSTFKKYTILSIIFLVQTSMNFNTSLYSNGLDGISEKFDVTAQAARAGAAIFLITYAFGCELWAPWSEEFGRKPVLQASLFLVNIWTIPVALAPNFATILVGRALGGLSSAGGSVTLGMIADMFDADNQQYAVAYIVFSSVGGSILGPIIGGFVQQYLAWQWTIWIQLIFGAFVQILHLIIVPETRTTIMLDNIAKKRRKTGVDSNVYGPNEIDPFWQRFTVKELLHTWVRPFRMFLTEPIVLALSLLSGFSDALIFMCIQSFSIVYGQWGFSPSQVGLSFIPIGIGYVIAWLSFIPAIKRNKAAREKNPLDEYAQYESRLYWLLWTVPCLPIGLIIFAWTSSGPPLPWVASMVGSAIIGIANYAIYMATIDYMICAYGPWAASATGGNGWSRDFLAGVLTVPATPFFTNIGAEKGMNLQYASTILFCISCILVIAVYVIYWKGPVLRKRSPFAESLAKNTGRHGERRASLALTKSHQAGLGSGPSSQVASHHAASSHNASRANSFDHAASTTTGVSRPGMGGDRFGPSSRRSSYYASVHAASRSASRNASQRNSFEDANPASTTDHTTHHPHHAAGQLQLAPIASVMQGE